jgi:hypothetical protein
MVKEATEQRAAPQRKDLRLSMGVVEESGIGEIAAYPGAQLSLLILTPEMTTNPVPA